MATENDPRLDGIVFPSVQAAGNALNVVLFHKAARVDALDIPEGTEIEASTGYTSEDGWEVDYSVNERVPPNLPEDMEDKHDLPNLAALARGGWTRDDSDLREGTLQIDLTSIKVHVVRRVQVEGDEHVVSRRRVEKRDYKF